MTTATGAERNDADRPDLPVDGRLRRGMKTREQLLDAAIDLFESKGFASTSMKDLAAAAGVQAPAIYNHFKSKEGILAAALEWALEDFQRVVIDPDEPTEPSVLRLEKLVRRHVAYQFSRGTKVRSTDNLIEEALQGRTLPSEDLAGIRSIVRRYRDLVTSLVTELRHDSEHEVAPTTLCVSAILNLCDRAGNWYRPGGDLTAADFEDGCWDLILGMLRQ